MRSQASFPLASAGALALIVLVFVRPQEFVPALEGLPLFNVAFGVTVVGTLAELLFRRMIIGPPALLALGAAWTLWTLVVTAFRLGVSSGFTTWLTSVVYQLIFMASVLVGAQTFRRLRTFALVIITVALGISGVLIHQSQQEHQCIQLKVEENGAIDSSVGEADGRSCESTLDCEKTSVSQTAAYACEKAGLLGTFSTAGRIRWRGRLADPNEVCVFLGAALALAFGLHAGSRARGRHVALGVVLAVVATTAVLSQSRGGLLVLMTVCGVPFVRRYGLRGVVVAGVLVSPALLLGGRSGAEAEESANERASLLYQGVDLVKSDPIFGVGVDAFRDHVYPALTAHNSYLLAAAELGVFGLLVFASLLYVTLKVPALVVLAPPEGLDPRLYGFALGLLAALLGMALGIFFLTMNYHPMPFIFFGLVGALHGIVREQHPSFRVRYTPREMAYVTVACAALVVILFVYTRIRGDG